ncbi:hypothetical protein CesoFtcFv8_007723 [Champsocephalus esox]|uniref:Carboxylic ester hydrolase n=1 Tax=Champsocephalus esox TaxID=159716 RepID=A0AAN8CHE5_9TELE|nr:hypothetical protein CesoFtcFv8_007723 [Champsocephalus esox]
MTFRGKQTFFFLTAVLFLYVAADPHAPEVHTKLGSLRGQTLSVKGQENGVHAYLGIPFAKPPVGPALRLAAPQPVEGWEGVRDTTKQPPMCVQYKNVTLDLLEKLGGMVVDLPDISEDCLYLNIYTPADRTPDAKLPVMVWIHGGGFAMGSVSTYDGSALAAYQDMVVVLIQYRLGLLGFLSTGDEHMSGNFGMLDQVEALRWIQQHIHNFGGNPDVVTIFGESAGGVSVSLLLLSPLSDGLFHHAIAESGTAGMDLLVANDPLPVAQMVANMSGCSLESTQKIADCMRIVDVKTIEALGEDQTLRISAAIAHRDAGADVYVYEYQYPPQILKSRRPSFVGSDHGDEIFTVLGLCFTTTHVTLPEPCTEEEEQLSRKMMSYWSNFARTGSPNGDGLAHWPKEYINKG